MCDKEEGSIVEQSWCEVRLWYVGLYKDKKTLGIRGLSDSIDKQIQSISNESQSVIDASIDNQIGSSSKKRVDYIEGSDGIYYPSSPSS